MTSPSSSSVQAAEETRDAMALTGLRRMVLHARDQLASTKAPLPSGEFAYGKHWEPGQIRRSAAAALAEQVLTLVADCIPADGGLSPDEAAQLQRHADELEARAKSLDAAVSRAAVETEEWKQKASTAESEARLNRTASEESDSELERLQRLAEAVRLTPAVERQRVLQLLARMVPDCYCDDEGEDLSCPVHHPEDES